MGYAGAKTNPGRDRNIVFDGLTGIGPSGDSIVAHGLANATGCPGWTRVAHREPDTEGYTPGAGRTVDVYGRRWCEIDLRRWCEIDLRRWCESRGRDSMARGGHVHIDLEWSVNIDIISLH